MLRSQDVRTPGGPDGPGRHDRADRSGHGQLAGRQPDEKLRGRGREHEADRRHRLPQPVPDDVPARHRRPVRRRRRQPDLGRGRQVVDGRQHADQHPELRLAVLRGQRGPAGVRRCQHQHVRGPLRPGPDGPGLRLYARGHPDAEGALLPGCRRPDVVDHRARVLPGRIGRLGGLPEPSTTAPCSSSTTRATASARSCPRPTAIPIRPRSSRSRAGSRIPSTWCGDPAATCSTSITSSSGNVWRLKYLDAPIARATATPNGGQAPIDIHLDGSASAEPDSDFQITDWDWDFDNDGDIDASGDEVDWHIAVAATHQVKLTVHSSSGLSDSVVLTIDADNAPPVPVINTPLDCAAPGCWDVGQPLHGHRHRDGRGGRQPDRLALRLERDHPPLRTAVPHAHDHDQVGHEDVHRSTRPITSTRPISRSCSPSPTARGRRAPRPSSCSPTRRPSSSRRRRAASRCRPATTPTPRHGPPRSSRRATPRSAVR